MKEMIGDFWQLNHELRPDAIVVTTNGVIKTNGELVMGKGIALDFATRYPKLPRALGECVKVYGNRVHSFGERDGVIYKIATIDDLYIFSFPTKHHWKGSSDLTLIEESANQLVSIVDAWSDPDREEPWDLNRILLTRPGCGNGGLNWADVKPVIEPYLDDRFIVVSGR